MNEEQNEYGTGVEEQPSELDLLKQRANTMGVAFHPNIGIDKLKDKLEDKMSGETKTELDPEELETINEYNVAFKGAKIVPFTQPTPQQLTMERRQKALRLVRIRIACMNPIKANLKGEIFSTGNAELGMIKKFVPFNAEAGYHVPQIILTMLQNKKFMTHYDVKIGNKKIKKNRLVPEFAIEIMPPLTSKELQELKQRQLMAQTK
jgi:hypothetical protein